MSLQEIEVAITRLSSEERLKLTDWLTEQYNDDWDEQIEEDARAGKLDNVLNEAREEIRKGRTKPL